MMNNDISTDKIIKMLESGAENRNFDFKKRFSDGKKGMKETWYCHILNIPRKNLIASTLVFFILVVLLEIVC